MTVVGMGASAGGLAALQSFFDLIPPDTGLAFVVVTHMDPERESLLPELLQTHTSMTVSQVRELMPVEANHVYVIPPNQRIVMTDTHLDLEEFEEPRGWRLPIDHFFRSLANVHRDAIAIILSGGGTDGAVGVKAIKEQGGLLMVQHPDEAEHNSMPRAAINTGLADVVLPVAQLVEKLVMYCGNGARVYRDPETLTANEMEILYRILTQVQARIGHDFSQYKQSTILRRIQRRMQLHGHATLNTYLNHLRHENDEAHALFNDLLIGVTNFFRDEEAWAALAEKVVPHLFKNKGPEDIVRVWTVGCATGEEAYSLAILLTEYLEKMDQPPAARPGIQVFASDLDNIALSKARAALYPEAIEADVSPERLQRFFIKEGHYYQVRRDLRDIVLFSNHNILRDPPFSRIDLISCRNLLIYLQRGLQENAFQIFYYALNAEGYLFLGSSESAEIVNQLFTTLDKTHRIYTARLWRGEHPHTPNLPLTMSRQTRKDVIPLSGQIQSGLVEKGGNTAGFHLDILERLAPPNILVDEMYRIIHTSKTAGRYLLHPGGVMTTDLLKQVRPELQFELRTALHEAFEANKHIVSLPVFVQFNGAPHRVTIAVKTQISRDSNEKTEGERLALIFFLEDEITRNVDERLSRLAAIGEQDAERHEVLIVQLEDEVQRLRERLQATTEESESSTEELKAANEELQSINEEYRSTTEELETSKEELQSVNEELQTVNAELKNKLEEISRAHSDLENLLASTEIATLFLDRELHIQRYTPGTAELFNIMPGDLGRPINHLTHNLKYEALDQDARQVLRTLVPIEHEVQDLDGHQLLLRVRPYRTVNDKIDGVVLTFVDITTIRETERALKQSRERYRLMAEGTTEYAMLTMDEDGRIDTWNQGARRLFGYEETEVIGKPGDIIFTLEDQQNDLPAAELKRAQEQGDATDERWYRRKDGSRFWGSGVLTALREDSQLRGYAKVLRDNTARKATEEALRQSEANLSEEVVALERLHQMTTRIVSMPHIQDALDEILNTSIDLVKADLGNIQLLDPENQVLVIAAQAGFEQPFLEKFHQVTFEDETACGRALRSGQRVIIEDVRKDKDYQPYLSASIEANFQAVQSTPLINREGGIVGVLSTHFRKPRTLSSRDKRILDLIARQAADLTERLRGEIELERRVEQRTLQVRRLASDLVAAEQTVRQRLAQILHDDLQQIIYAVQIQLQFLQEENKANAEFQDLEEMVHQALALTRQLTMELSPPVLEGEGLDGALIWLAKHMEELYHLQVTVETSAHPLISDERRILLYRIVRELLFNVVKHAGVLTAKVTLQDEGSGLTLTVSDGGNGFDPSTLSAQDRTSYGLPSIHKRLELFGGRANIESRLGEGTRITLFLPYEQDLEEDVGQEK